jgi:hypothetical protein
MDNRKLHAVFFLEFYGDTRFILKVADLFYCK